MPVFYTLLRDIATLCNISKLLCSFHYSEMKVKEKKGKGQ